MLLLLPYSHNKIAFYFTHKKSWRLSTGNYLFYFFCFCKKKIQVNNRLFFLPSFLMPRKVLASTILAASTQNSDLIPEQSDQSNILKDYLFFTLSALHSANNKKTNRKIKWREKMSRILFQAHNLRQFKHSHAFIITVSEFHLIAFVLTYFVNWYCFEIETTTKEPLTTTIMFI